MAKKKQDYVTPTIITEGEPRDYQYSAPSLEPQPVVDPIDRSVPAPVLSDASKLAIRNSQFAFIAIERDFAQLKQRHQKALADQESVLKDAFNDAKADPQHWHLDAETLEFKLRSEQENS